MSGRTSQFHHGRFFLSPDNSLLCALEFFERFVQLVHQFCIAGGRGRDAVARRHQQGGHQHPAGGQHQYKDQKDPQVPRQGADRTIADHLKCQGCVRQGRRSRDSHRDFDIEAKGADDDGCQVQIAQVTVDAAAKETANSDKTDVEKGDGIRGTGDGAVPVAAHHKGHAQISQRRCQHAEVEQKMVDRLAGKEIAHHYRRKEAHPSDQDDPALQGDFADKSANLGSRNGHDSPPQVKIRRTTSW